MVPRICCNVTNDFCANKLKSESDRIEVESEVVRRKRVKISPIKSGCKCFTSNLNIESLMNGDVAPKHCRKNRLCVARLRIKSRAFPDLLRIKRQKWGYQSVQRRKIEILIKCLSL